MEEVRSLRSEVRSLRSESDFGIPVTSNEPTLAYKDSSGNIKKIFNTTKAISDYNQLIQKRTDQLNMMVKKADLAKLELSELKARNSSKKEILNKLQEIKLLDEQIKEFQQNPDQWFY